MQATIIYLLTEKAQRTHLATTGQPIPRKHQVEHLEIPNGWANHPQGEIIWDTGEIRFDLTMGAEIGDNGVIQWNYKSTYHRCLVKGEFDTAPASGLEALETFVRVVEAKSAERKQEQTDRLAREEDNRREQEARKAEEAAKKEAIKQAFLSDPTARASHLYERQYEFNYKGELIKDHDAYLEAARRREADETAVEDEKRKVIKLWIFENASDAIKQQFSEGLLARKKVLKLMAEDVLKALPEAQALVDICDNSECPCGNTDMDTIPPEEYRHWVELRKLLPEGYKVKFQYHVECLGDEDDHEFGNEPKYYTATVTVPHGPFKFERVIKLEHRPAVVPSTTVAAQ